MNYHIEKNSEGWFVVETETDHVVSFHQSSITAKSQMRRLNSGSGFDGFTPAFFALNSSNSFSIYL